MAVPELLGSVHHRSEQTQADLSAVRSRALLERLAKERYLETALLSQVNGVGLVTSVSYVLTLEDPSRFAKSRQVGSWTGLCPRSHASGDKDPQLGISETGDPYLRRLLVQCAQYILGPFGEDCDLRRFGLRLVDRGGGRAKARAVVAVARKLAVLLHRLWVTGEVYEPLRQAERRAKTQAACTEPAAVPA